MKRTKKRISALRALTWRITAFALGLWLLCMSCLTVGTALYIYDELCSVGSSMASNAVQFGRLNELYDGGFGSDMLETDPGILEFRMLEAIGIVGARVSRPGGWADYYRSTDLPNIFRDKSFTCDTAAAVFAPDGSILFESGDYIHFTYVSEADYLAGEEARTAGNAWMDLNDESDTRYDRFRVTYAGTGSLYDIRAMRITGYFDGARMEPLAISVVTDSLLHRALDAREPEEHIVHPDGTEEIRHEFTHAQLEAEGLLEWDTIFDRTDTAPADRELVTVYSFYSHMEQYEPGKPVRYQRVEKHENLLALLRTMDYSIMHTHNIYGAASVFSLREVILFDAAPVRDLRQYDYTDASTWPEPEFYVATALRASPLGLAARFLLWVYVLTLVFALIGIAALRGVLRKKLIEPLREVNEGIEAGYKYMPRLREHPPVWREPYALSRNYFDTQEQLRIRQNEVTRLNTALRYAKTAEENRRQMTSSIAHELKTPLAVIHGYAEGLKEHIAEDKRDRYLDVILSESERMDAMVLEMLDLSRLEAGKVRLARDEFSLAELTRAVLEKLEMAANAKNLRIDCDFPEKSGLVADEARIAQVVENFLSNAVRYTPAGGHIAVTIRRGEERVSFTVENDSAPLTDEALAKVWDTFYRADESRSGGGTGLGLAIAKNIVELHGGSCSVKNTKNGVAFSFTL